MIDSTLKEYTGFCPHCDHRITFTSARFNVINDNDDALALCNNCSKQFIIPSVENIETFWIREGAKNITTEHSFTDDIPVCNGLACTDTASTGIFLETPFAYLQKKRMVNPFLDPNCPPLYTCECGENLEQATMTLLSGHSELNNFVHNLSPIYHKGYCNNSEKIIFYLPLQCNCGKNYTSVLFTHTYLYGKYPTAEECFIADIQGCSSQFINGVYTKDQCCAFVKKFALRWYLISTQRYVVSAFIGNQFQKPHEACELWNDLAICFSPTNSSCILTKTRTNNSYRKKIESDPVLALQNKYGKVESTKININSFEKTHSKFYAGVTALGVEVLSGSYNFAKGPSTDNLTYSILPFEKFKTHYLSPLKKESSLLPVKQRQWFVFHDLSAKNTFSYQDHLIQYQDMLTSIFFPQTHPFFNFITNS